MCLCFYRRKNLIVSPATGGSPRKGLMGKYIKSYLMRCVPMYVHAYIHTCYVCTYVCMYVRIDMCMYVCTYVCAYMYVLYIHNL